MIRSRIRSRVAELEREAAWLQERLASETNYSSGYLAHRIQRLEERLDDVIERVSQTGIVELREKSGEPQQ